MPEIGLFTMVVLIVLIVSLTRLAQSRHARDAATAPDAARLEGEVQALKDRVAVLERILTENDRGLALDREIERLRDRR